MPSYHFVARSDRRRGEDLGLMAMLDDADARAFARRVIVDLMRSHPAFYQTWTIDISEDERVVASIPFAEGRPYLAQPVQCGNRHEGQQAPRVVEDKPREHQRGCPDHGSPLSAFPNLRSGASRKASTVRPLLCMCPPPGEPGRQPAPGPRPFTNSRRVMPNMGLPPTGAAADHSSKRAATAAVLLPHFQPAGGMRSRSLGQT